MCPVRSAVGIIGYAAHLLRNRILGSGDCDCSFTWTNTAVTGLPDSWGETMGLLHTVAGGPRRLQASNLFRQPPVIFRNWDPQLG